MGTAPVTKKEVRGGAAVLNPAMKEERRKVDRQPGKVRVVVLGGGTAGWMTAAALVGHLGRIADVTLIESAEIGIVGVGEATLPHIRQFIHGLGIDERAFMAATNATYKLGIAFEDFGAAGERYMHPFSVFGRPLAGVPFHHFWLRSGAGDIGAWSPGVAAARAGRFAPPEPADRSLAASYNYAYQFDATLFGPFLRDWATARGAARIEAKVVEVVRAPSGGDVAALVLEDGRRIEADLFVDCSGFRSLLLGGALEEGWEDWSRWLACDRAAALPSASPPGEIEPLTRVTSMPAGWRWRIPLRHRVGNGDVYSSAHLSDDEACAAILQAVDAEAQAEPRVLRFKAGRRRRSWVGNVVGVGLASGFLEPLESTSLYLVQMAIARLIELFPLGGAQEADRREFNRLVDLEYDRIRDFLILHYHATRRDHSPFWRDMAAMAVPDSLGDRIALWRRTGRVETYGEGLFLEASWVAVLIGQGIVPEGYDLRADIPDSAGVARVLAAMRQEIDAAVAAMPGHREALG
jgi:tryptophan halogenase